jgi:hypothetical protein
MARMNFVIDDKLEGKFRKKVFDRYGMKKGNIQLAVEEALREWIAKTRTTKRGSR